MNLPDSVVLPFDVEAISSGDPGQLKEYLQKLVSTVTDRLDGTAQQVNSIQNAIRLGSFTRDLSAASGDVSYTGVGFTPNCLLLTGAVSGSNVAFWGLATKGLNYCINTPYNGSSGTYEAVSSLIKACTESGKYQSAAVKSWDWDGFTLTWTNTGSPTGTLVVYYLAMRLQ